MKGHKEKTNQKVTFSRLGEHGRLGNQLWQYAFLRAYKQKTNADVYLPILKEKMWHGQPCLLNCFNIQLPQRHEKKLKSEYNQHDLSAQIYENDVFGIEDDVDFVGFFQNTLYFSGPDGCEDILRQEFTLKGGMSQIIDKQIQNLKKTAQREVVSIHVRRGDLLEQTKDLNFFGGSDSIYTQYLNKALENFPKDKYAFLIFTGGSRENSYEEDVKWCQENLPFDWENDFVQVYSTGNPVIDFGLISACDHNIVSHASSFSWWAAYLNNKSNAKIIAPKYYFVDDRTKFIPGFYPKWWKLVE